jgi:hypothetical protein
MDGQQDHHPDIHSPETGKTALILPLVSADPLKLFQLIYLRILSFNLLKSKKSLTLRYPNFTFFFISYSPFGF